MAVYKIYDLVKQTLEKKPETRKSDKILYLEILLKLGLARSNRTIFGWQVTIKDWNKIPSFETVRRARQKLQEMYPELRPDNYKQGKRKEKEETKGTFIFRETVKI